MSIPKTQFSFKQVVKVEEAKTYQVSIVSLFHFRKKNMTLFSRENNFELEIYKYKFYKTICCIFSTTFFWNSNAELVKLVSNQLKRNVNSRVCNLLVGDRIKNFI